MKKIFKFVLCAVIETILSELFIENSSINGIILFIAVYIILSLVVNVIK